MAFTRFNYDPCRTQKILQEATGPGRYMLETPGAGCNPCFMEDPEIRLQKWGANLRKVDGGHPIDINSDLLGITRPLTKDCVDGEYPENGITKSKQTNFPTCAAFTHQSRATHPAWQYRDLEQVNWYPLLLNPQENVCMNFQNNLNTRLLEKDHYVKQYPCLK